MTKNAKELWDRSNISTISMTTGAEQAFFSRRFTGPCNELHKTLFVTCSGKCHYVSRAWGVPLNVGRLVPVTTFGDQAQITKPGINKIGALENQTTGMDLQGPSKPKTNLWCTRRCAFLQKANPIGTRTRTLSTLGMVVFLIKMHRIQR